MRNLRAPSVLPVRNVDPRAFNIDLTPPIGPRPWDWMVKREPWFPAGESHSWEDLYATWFGRWDQPLANYKLWFGAPRSIDERLRRAYQGMWRDTVAGRLTAWEDDPKACVAQLILVDQLGRNMFRGQKEAFLHDDLGLHLAERCLAHLEAGARYHLEDVLVIAWPWLHQESREQVERARRWVYALGEVARGTPYHVRMVVHQFGFDRHVRCIERFGRYPGRNAVLQRPSTPAEEAYLREEVEMWESDQSEEGRGGTWQHSRKLAAYMLRQSLYFYATGHGWLHNQFWLGCAKAWLLGR